METCNRILALLRQNRKGIRISEIVRKLHPIDRSTVYRNLGTLDLRGLAYFERGIAYPGKRREKITKEQLELLKEMIRANAGIESAVRRAEGMAYANGTPQ